MSPWLVLLLLVGCFLALWLYNRRAQACRAGFQDVVADPVFGQLVWQGYGDGDWWQSAGRVAYGGGTVGLLLGILGGPLGMLVGTATGAAIGGLAGKLIDTGIPDGRLREIGALLTPNTSAIVAMVEPTHVQSFQAALAQGGGATLTQPLAAGVPEQLQAMRDEADTTDTPPPPAGGPST